MGYRLKPEQEEFTITDGPLAGMNFKKNVEYVSAPEGYEDRFKKILEAPASETPEPASTPKEVKTMARAPKINPKEDNDK